MFLFKQAPYLFALAIAAISLVSEFGLLKAWGIALEGDGLQPAKELSVAIKFTGLPCHPRHDSYDKMQSLRRYRRLCICLVLFSVVERNLRCNG